MAALKKQKASKPYKKAQKVTMTKEDMIREKLLNDDFEFYTKEAYKSLRTRVTFSLPYDGCKKLLVTSSLASEGKSTNCINLSITFAQTGVKVCVIDCDLRRPNVHRLFGVDSVPGLSNALIGMNSIDEVIRHSKYENLDYICAGDIPPNPAELLGSEKFLSVIEELEKRYDYIICDTCPVNIVTDTAIIAKVIPDVVVIALQNSTERDALKEAVKNLEFAGAKIIGFVLNGVEFNYKGGYKYRYGNKYYRAGGRYGASHSYGKSSYYKTKQTDSAK